MELSKERKVEFISYNLYTNESADDRHFFVY